jgi:hypothetical protein
MKLRRPLYTQPVIVRGQQCAGGAARRRSRAPLSRLFNQTIIPRARELPGFQGGYWLADRATGKFLAVVVYDSEEHVRQTDEVAAQLRQQAGSVGGVNFTGVETYEVIAQA